MTDDRAATRSRARQHVKALLGISEVSAVHLFARARDVLGVARSERCQALVARAALSRRDMTTSNVASLVLGTDRMSKRWWTTRSKRLPWGDDALLVYRTPDALLEAADPSLGSERVLTTLGNWAADAAADAEWGKPIATFDANDPRGTDRVAVPIGARVGDHLLAAWDPGCRAWVEVIKPWPDRRDRLGSVVGPLLSHDVSDVAWAWGTASNAAPIRLPGETLEAPSDPWAAAIAPDLAARLHDTASLAFRAAIGPGWTTKVQLWAAVDRLGLSRRPGAAPLWFGRAAHALFDDDRPAADRWVAELERSVG